MHTEVEARERWCPLVRYDADGVMGEVAHNRTVHDLSPPVCRCIASDCMMWRWAGLRYFDQHGKPMSDEDYEALLGRDFDYPLPEQRAIGFCGLAGRPS